MAPHISTSAPQTDTSPCSIPIPVPSKSKKGIPSPIFVSPEIEPRPIQSIKAHILLTPIQRLRLLLLLGIIRKQYLSFLYLSLRPKLLLRLLLPQHLRHLLQPLRHADGSDAPSRRP